MAKMNANTASREQLVEAGIRAELADEILKLRRKEKITSLAALIQLPGNGPFTHARLRSLLDFTDQADEPTRETAEALRSATRAGTEVSSRTASATDSQPDARSRVQCASRNVGKLASQIIP